MRHTGVGGNSEIACRVASTRMRTKNDAAAMDSSPEEVTTPPARRPPNDDNDEEDEDDEVGVDAPEEEEEEEDEEEDEEDDDAPPPSSTVIRSHPTLQSLQHLRDLSKDVISWNLSSAKPDNGIEQIVNDPSTETYWQSDGSQPHTLRVHFGRRVRVSHVCLYLDYNLDESYTPKTIQVKAGMTIQDLRDITGNITLHEPHGWCILTLTAPPDPLDALQNDDNEEEEQLVQAHLVEISILAMHQNGRDTHVRRVKLFGPKRGEQSQPCNRIVREENTVLLDRNPVYTTVAMTQFNTIR